MASVGQIHHRAGKYTFSVVCGFSFPASPEPGFREDRLHLTTPARGFILQCFGACRLERLDIGITTPHHPAFYIPYPVSARKRGILMNALQVMLPRRFDPIQIPAPNLPPDSRDWVLIKTAWVSMCGSDIPFFTGKKRHRSYPMPPGAPIHECVGEVMESASVQFRPGDKVLAIPDGDRGLAEFFLAQSSKTLVLQDEFDNTGAACIIQPLSTVVNAMDRLGDIRGKSLAVLGLGSIGLMFCWLAAKRGAGFITGIDPHPGRCKIGEELGATRTLCKKSIEVVQKARVSSDEWTPPEICIEAVGHQMDTINDALELVRKRGTVLAFGVPDHNVYALEYEMFFRKNAVLIATVTPDWAAYLPKARDLFQQYRRELSGLFTHRMAIREAQTAFEMYERHEEGIVKALLDATSW
jgi:threonine dehydrogenase-like Zn-dependent dehydrogenase